MDDATLAEIESALGQDGVWVAPELRSEISPQDEHAVEQAVAGSGTPTFVVLTEMEYADPLTGSFDQLAALIHDDTGRDGYYLGLPVEPETLPLEVTSFPEDLDAYQAARIAWFDHPEDVAAQAAESVELLDGGTDLSADYDQRVEEDPRAAQMIQDAYFGGGDSADEDGSAGGIWLGVGGVVVALLVLAVVFRARRGRRRPVATTSRPTPTFALPATVVRSVRAAETRAREEQATREVADLGEALDRAPLDPELTDAYDAWQSALDHYELARRILDRSHTPADVVGAIVLGRRGAEALRAAERGRRWVPGSPCWFNPLHGGSVRTVTWTDPEVEAPACADCARQAEKGEEPTDTLEFVADEATRAYFRLDLGVWSRTGFGALEPDLVAALTNG
ncbi:hypothetical protein [Nocardioides insulae]|uniref:hypothetical protein n=1 Tax=Nocardioides insulae TaxID=394734 RepID=UPI0004053C2E|nr:hypothetical protein [Nocardioides insulae]